MRQLCGLLLIGLLALPSLALTAGEVGPFEFRMPSWVPLPIVPDDNPMSEAKIELGRHLFYDTALSATA